MEHFKFMARSLFSPFASSINPYAARGLRNLFTGPDTIDINPAYIELLKSGVEPSAEMLMTTPMFKGGKSAKEANAKVLSNLVQAQFGSELATSKEKELIPFRSQTEIEQAKTLSDYAREQQRKIEEENLSNIGTARGQVLGSLPTEQLSNILPQGTTFGNPAEQERFYQSQVGGNVPVNKAIVETNPNVITGRVGEEAGKRFIDLGSGFKYDPITGEFIQGGRYENVQQQVPFDTGELTPIIDPTTGLPSGKFTTKKALKLQSQPEFFPPHVGKAVATEDDFKNIPKESGAEVKGNLLAPGYGTNLNALQQPLPTNLPLNTELKQPPTVLAQPGNDKKSFWQKFNSYFPKEAQEFLKPKEEKKEEPKEKPKAYPLEHLIEAYQLDKNQKESFEFFVQNYTKNQGKYPSLEEARAYIKTLTAKKNK